MSAPIVSCKLRLPVEVLRHTAAAQAAEMERIAWRHMGRVGMTSNAYNHHNHLYACLLSNHAYHCYARASQHKHRDY